MSYPNINTKPKNKHLNFNHYEYIQLQYNHFVATKAKDKTKFMRKLAQEIGTTLSNLYLIIKAGLVELKNYDLTTRREFSVTCAWQKRTTRTVNHSKVKQCKAFIDQVVMQFKDKDNRKVLMKSSMVLKRLCLICLVFVLKQYTTISIIIRYLLK